MNSLKQLFENNHRWATGIKTRDPSFFSKLSGQQSPEYLWIGCSDSRVPANEIVGLLPGELFVHRNVANVVIHTDLNCLSVMQYAVQVLRVKHIIVCGHYGCGGVRAALQTARLGLIDNWLLNIKDIGHRHRTELDALTNEKDRTDRLCELNVLEQARNVAHTAIVQDAWHRGQSLAIHSWIYGIHDGILKDLGATVDQLHQVPPLYRFAERSNGN